MGAFEGPKPEFGRNVDLYQKGGQCSDRNNCKGRRALNNICQSEATCKTRRVSHAKSVNGSPESHPSEKHRVQGARLHSCIKTKPRQKRCPKATSLFFGILPSRSMLKLLQRTCQNHCACVVFEHLQSWYQVKLVWTMIGEKTSYKGLFRRSKSREWQNTACFRVLLAFAAMSCSIRHSLCICSTNRFGS